MKERARGEEVSVNRRDAVSAVPWLSGCQEPGCDIPLWFCSATITSKGIMITMTYESTNILYANLIQNSVGGTRCQGCARVAAPQSSCFPWWPQVPCWPHSSPSPARTQGLLRLTCQNSTATAPRFDSLGAEITTPHLLPTRPSSLHCAAWESVGGMTSTFQLCSMRSQPCAIDTLFM
jgi:hypothetical protein